MLLGGRYPVLNEEMWISNGFHWDLAPPAIANWPHIEPTNIKILNIPSSVEQIHILSFVFAVFLVSARKTSVKVSYLMAVSCAPNSSRKKGIAIDPFFFKDMPQ